MRIRAIRSVRVFFVSCAGVLCLTAAAKLYSATGTARILLVRDPLLGVNNRLLMVALGLLEVAVAIWLLWSLRPERQSAGAAGLLWLSSNFLAYRLGRYLLGVMMCPCLGTLTAKLPLSPDTVEAVLRTLVVFWVVGSLLILWRSQQGLLCAPVTEAGAPEGATDAESASPTV